MYSVILGHLGTDAVAANSLVVVVRNIGSVFCFGIASAGGILLGNVMGQGDLERSRRYASKTLKLTVIAGFWRTYRSCHHTVRNEICVPDTHCHALSEIYASDQQLLYYGVCRKYNPDRWCVPGRW